ncbi:MAG: PilN domain-containing protein [Phycisphaerales bacterium JB047]
MSSTTIALVNLVPSEAQLARARRHCMGKWICAFAATCVLVGIPGAYIGGNAALSDPSIDAQIEHVSNQLGANEAAIPKLQARLGQLQEKEQVLELVKNRIDWRDVFAQFVVVSDDRVRFTALSALGAGVEGDQPISIQIQGIASTQTDARAFVVAVESLGLFDEIELARTARRDIDGQEVIEFQIFVRVGETPEDIEVTP